MEINTREDFGMVWMGGDMLLQSDPTDLMMEHSVDSPFYVDSNAHTLTEDEIRCRNQMGMEGFMMLEDLDDSSRWYVNGMPEEMMLDPEQPNSAKVVTTATQTGLQNAPPGSRKIKPVKHPGLKLQTPIAYQRDTDLNVIPIQKDGQAVCKKCGAIGVKHAFYTRERCYCSMACARGSVEHDINNPDDESPTSNTQWSEEVLTPQENQEENQQPQAVFLNVNCNPTQYLVQQPTLVESPLPPVFILQSEEPTFHTEKKSMPYSYDWTIQLNDPYFSSADVSYFPHAPMTDMWHSIDVGVKVEVENTDMDDFCEEFPNSFWIASVLRVEGYKALLRYEGFIDDGSKDFWINICSQSIHPVGWCAARGKPLIPPNSIKNKYNNWKEFLKKRLTGARTLPSNFSTKVQDSIKSRFRRDLTVEVVDKYRISQVKVATIEKITGKRLQLRYYDSKPGSPELFWCHEDSPLIHPVGWAKGTGQKLDAPLQYHDRIMKGLREKDDATADLFLTPERFPRIANCFFQEGMKLEAIDPLNLSDICVATVMQVLNDGYLMICVDFWNDQHPTTEDWFCYHMTSPCIFPAGFCAANNISLTPPKDYDKATFDWNRYLQETGCIAAPAILFNREIHDHGFKVGMKLEAADLMNPRLVCVATISKVVGNLLRIRFDGWNENYDQWLSHDSCDLYPVGWCELVQHKLEPPYNDTKAVVSDPRTGSRKRRGKNNVVFNKTVSNADKNELFNNEGSTLLQTPLVTTLPNTVIPNRANVEEKKAVGAPAWSSNLMVSYTNESTLVNSTSIGSGKHLVKIDLDEDIEEGSSGSDVNNVDSPGSSVQESLTEQINKCMVEKPKIIPRLSDIKSRGSGMSILPGTWDVNDVAEFLKINDCSTYCDAFIKQGIDGNKLLELTKEEVHALVGMKVGPSLKIQNLISQLTSKVNPASSRHSKTLKNVL